MTDSEGFFEVPYYRILDLSDYAELNVMLQKIGGIILETAPEQIKSRSSRMSFILTILCLAVMLGIYLATAGLTDEFRSAAQITLISK